MLTVVESGLFSVAIFYNSGNERVFNTVERLISDMLNEESYSVTAIVLKTW